MLQARINSPIILTNNGNCRLKNFTYTDYNAIFLRIN